MNGYISCGKFQGESLNEREILVYKNCTNNCTFVYPSEVPPEAPRSKYFKTNSFYFVRCCNTINCNEGGPLTLEKDILPDYTIEENISGTVPLGESTFFLSVASILVSNTLT
ncbi:glycosyl-phosphatidylinositol-anchored molecule-like protein [Phoca vitulina]|uniref:glycosyl-phosphatidylinositol-anchored molecule-like protein n=1 Tax=Phoca vitulina TaxID=9720 RepID=UPI00139645C2|nr:glycosyl-phosphatidylinositol-anchored molecule-like protein [Phoca vitulina]